MELPQIAFGLCILFTLISVIVTVVRGQKAKIFIDLIKAEFPDEYDRLNNQSGLTKRYKAIWSLFYDEKWTEKLSDEMQIKQKQVVRLHKLSQYFLFLALIGFLVMIATSL